MNKKKRDVEKAINEALKHEDDLQHDKNPEPTTFVNDEDANSIKHEDEIELDENDEPVTFAGKS